MQRSITMEMGSLKLMTSGRATMPQIILMLKAEKRLKMKFCKNFWRLLKLIVKCLKKILFPKLGTAK